MCSTCVVPSSPSKTDSAVSSSRLRRPHSRPAVRVAPVKIQCSSSFIVPVHQVASAGTQADKRSWERPKELRRSFPLDSGYFCSDGHRSPLRVLCDHNHAAPERIKPSRCCEEGRCREQGQWLQGTRRGSANTDCHNDPGRSLCHVERCRTGGLLHGSAESARCDASLQLPGEGGGRRAVRCRLFQWQLDRDDWRNFETGSRHRGGSTDRHVREGGGGVLHHSVPADRDWNLASQRHHLAGDVFLPLPGSFQLSPCEWNEPKNEENHFTFMNSLWFGAGALALQGVTPRPKALSVRVIAAVWWLFTIALLAAYIANFTALLSSGSEQLPVQTFEDLVKQRKLEFGTLEGSSTFYYFKNSKNPIHQMIYEYMDKRRDHVLVKTYQEAVQRVMDSNYAFIGESISQDLAAARHCNLIRAPEVIGARGFGIATAQASRWTKQLSVAVLKLRESGDLDYLRNKWWESSCLHKSRERWSPLQPQALGGLFLTLAIGLALGVLAAVAELSNKSRRAAGHAKKSCCSVFTEEMCTRLRIKENARQSQETSGRANA
ncbi:probable glutamate receptor isoform X2 [Columba livia]|uniref:probable glutamate receptor isoform X2 n=1 Tax=Columba livia TaxID=8932 RepID=UPI0031BA851B